MIAPDENAPQVAADAPHPDLIKAAMVALDLSEPLARAALKRGVKDMNAWKHAKALQDEANAELEGEPPADKIFASNERAAKLTSKAKFWLRKAYALNTAGGRKDLERYVRFADMRALEQAQDEAANDAEAPKQSRGPL